MIQKRNRKQKKQTYIKELLFFNLPDALLNGPSGVCFLLEYSISPFPNIGSYGANVAIVQTESLWKNAPPGVWILFKIRMNSRDLGNCIDKIKTLTSRNYAVLFCYLLPFQFHTICPHIFGFHSFQQLVRLCIL